MVGTTIGLGLAGCQPLTSTSADSATPSAEDSGDSSATARFGPDGILPPGPVTEKICRRPITTISRQATATPPGGLKAKETPLFVSLGWDDNGEADGIDWALSLFARRKNPHGNGNLAVFDDQPARSTFYLTAKYGENPATLSAWQRVVKSGHEIGNHTFSHTTGVKTTTSQWSEEIAQFEEKVFTSLGLSCEDVVGFRTPFLEHSDATLKAVAAGRYLYDCSMEEGFAPNEDGRNFVWPYTLDQGSPGNAALSQMDAKAEISPHPGLWEMPVYAFIVPPDSACKKYGVRRGLRKRLAKVDPDFDPKQGKITGFDYNLWYLYRVSGKEALAIWKYTYDQRKLGNRAPFLLGMHSDIYSEVAARSNAEEKKVRANWMQRRKAVEDLIAYIAKDPDARFTTVLDTLNWISDPKPM
jgi:hypothetical protein